MHDDLEDARWMINEGRDLKVGENYCRRFKNADETCGVSENW